MKKNLLDASDVLVLACDLVTACQKAGFEAPAFKTMRIEGEYRDYDVVQFEGPNADRGAIWCAKWLTKQGIGNSVAFRGNGECGVSSWSVE